MSSYFDFIDTDLLDRKLKAGSYPFTSKLFYQTNLSSLQATLNKNEIIETILTVGLLEDFYVLLKLYKNFEIKSAIKCSFLFDKKTANFCSLYFKIPLTEIYASQKLDYSFYHLSL